MNANLTILTAFILAFSCTDAQENSRTNPDLNSADSIINKLI